MVSSVHTLLFLGVGSLGLGLAMLPGGVALSTWAAAAPASDDDVVAMKPDRVSTRPSWASPAVSPSLRVAAVCRFVGLYPWRGRMGSFVPRRRQVSAVRRGYPFSDAALEIATATELVLQVGG